MGSRYVRVPEARGADVRPLDLNGQVFGRLHVSGRAPPMPDGAIWWDCNCDCGNTHRVRGADLKRGFVLSCGCWRKEMPKTRSTHMGSGTRLYRIWQAMRDRTSNPNNSKYKYYGGRGISVCVEWREFCVFADWARSAGYEDVQGARRDHLTIDRINPDLGYHPDNCRWVPQRIQVLNRRPPATWRGRPVKRICTNETI